MRKILFGLITLLLIALSIYIAINGLEYGSFKINSVSEIKQEDEKLEQKINLASKLKNEKYPQSEALLNDAYDKLIQEKQNYEQLLQLGVDENGETLNKIAEYETAKLWITLGNYAKREGVDMKIHVTSNNSISKTYNLNFTIKGGYIQIVDFLYDIEKDSTLVFKIEDFKLVPGENNEILTATFACKDVKVNISENEEIISSQEPVVDENINKENTENNTNTSNTTNSNTNTTNNTTNNSTINNTNTSNTQNNTSAN